MVRYQGWEIFNDNFLILIQTMETQISKIFNINYQYMPKDQLSYHTEQIVDTLNMYNGQNYTLVNLDTLLDTQMYYFKKLKPFIKEIIKELITRAPTELSNITKNTELFKQRDIIYRPLYDNQKDDNVVGKQDQITNLMSKVRSIEISETKGYALLLINASYLFIKEEMENWDNMEWES